jgi:Family of unknown function (DUF6152)
MNAKGIAALAAASASICPITAQAHHGTAAYDLATTIALEGRVIGFQWANPHALIRVVVDADAAAEEWTAETAGLVILVRAGWDKATLHPGDRCTLVGHPAKNGSHSMILQHLVLADGRELGNLVP